MSAKEDSQLIFPLAVQAAYKLSQRGVYDAQTLKREDPERYDLIVKYLKGTISKRLISEAVDCAYETVVAVFLDQQKDIRAGKRATSLQLDIAIAYGMEGLIEQAKAGKLSSIDVAVLIDKRELLNGGVTERVGHVQEIDPDVEEFRRYSEAKELPAMVLGMGSGEGKLLEEGGLDPLGEDGALIDVSGDPIEATLEERDSQSHGDNTQHAEPE